MTVPKGKTIWIGNREYKEGVTLPSSYNPKEKKKGVSSSDVRVPSETRSK